MSDPVEFPGDAYSGISESDQQEIRAEIEKVAAENRMQFSESLLEYKPERNGTVFPLIANGIGLLLLAGGLALLFTLFRSEDAQIRSAEQSVAATESRLIQELRRETEERLAEKEAEIAQIETRLASIAEERAALAQDMESQIREREVELQEQFQAELEAERQRLQNLNLSEVEIEARLAEFEAEKRQEYNERLAVFRERMVAEQQRLEQDLNSLEQQFSRTLEQASEERQAILEESEARISEIQTEFESQLAESEAELSAAQQELARLSRSREQEQLIRGQMTGLYQQLSGQMREGAYEDALGTLDTLETLLNEQSTLRIEALREERGTNLFVIRTMREYINDLQETRDPETIARLSDASLVRRAEELSQEAEAAAQAGDEELAGTLHRQALETIPAVASSFAWFENSANGEDLEALSAANESSLALIEAGDAALDEEDYSGAIDSYAEALERYPNSIYRAQAVSGLRSSVEELRGAFEEQVADLNAEQASLELALEERGELTNEEITALESENSRLSAEIDRQENQIEILQNQRTALETQRENLRGQIETLRDQRETQQQRIEELQGRIGELDGEIRRLEETITARDQALAESRRTEASLREQLAAASTTDPADQEIIEELTNLRAMRNELDSAEELYAGYLSEAENLGSGAEDVELVETKLRLDEFLGSTAVESFFPGLLDEIRRYESAFERSGRENAMVDMADLMYELSTLDSADARISEIQQRRSETEQPLMRDFLDELTLLLEE